MDGSADGSSASREAAVCAKNQPGYGGLVRQLSRDLVSGEVLSFTATGHNHPTGPISSKAVSGMISD